MTRRTLRNVERTPAIGESFGHYRVLGVVGGGSLGRIYVGEQQGLRGVAHSVNLLCVSAELAQAPNFRTRFFEAASIAPRFEHPNLVTIHEMGEIDGIYFVGMERLAAESVVSILARRNAGAAMPIDIAASVVKHAATALQYVHDRLENAALPVGVGHVELHPSNLFVTYHGTVRLLGLGLRPLHVSSEPASSGEHSTHWWSPVGALAAPEESAGITDRRTDVFCLGAVLWACLTGERPEPASRGGEAEPTSSALRAPPSSRRADVPEALDAIAMRALSRDPGERFQTAQDLADALEHFLVRRNFPATNRHIRRWMEQSFGAEKASLSSQSSTSLPAQRAPSPASQSSASLQAQSSASQSSASLQAQSSAAPASATQPVSKMRPRLLWSVGQPGSTRRRRGASSAPPLSLRGSARPVSQERLPVSAAASSAPPTLVRAPAQLMQGTSGAPSAAPGARAPRAGIIVLLVVTCALVAAGAGVILWSPVASAPGRDVATTSATRERSGQVEVKSTPEGAAVFIDGEPTGLHTPVVIKGLGVGRKLRLRVEKPGFGSEEQEVQITEGTVEGRAFTLVASDGFVRFAGAPAGARIFVDDVAVSVDSGGRVSLSAGRHTVRVETTEALLFSGTVNVATGEQTIQVDGTVGSRPGAAE